MTSPLFSLIQSYYNFGERGVLLSGGVASVRVCAYSLRSRLVLKKRWHRGGQGEEVQARQGGAGQAAVQGVNQLNQAQCGQGAQTDFYLNRRMRGSVCRLHPATGGGG